MSTVGGGGVLGGFKQDLFPTGKIEIKIENIAHGNTKRNILGDVKHLKKTNNCPVVENYL